ncbi:MAG TPA: multidrug effflux MFS transporter [Pseudolabrys sp.]|jgi:DHA1 family bicyclomycin/chloramphenicol resistance-like MFS transporter|nr:multidrug effflux MFS transporter [Pseudolabrys sp.]
MLRPHTFALTALLAALSAVGPLTTDMYLPSLPDIARLLHASTAQTQFTISSYLIGFAVGQIVYGPFSDRHGRKPVLIIAVALYCVATLGCALSTSIEMLIVARALQAVGGSGGVVLARAIVRDLYSGSRAGRELSVIASVMALAPVLAPVIGGALQTAFGWRASFFVLAASGVIGIGVIWLLLPETLVNRAKEPVSPATMLGSYRIVARNRCYLAYMSLIACSYAGLFAWISGASFVLQNLYGLSAFNFGVAFALGSVGYMTGSTIAARIVGRLDIDLTTGLGGVALTVGGLGLVAAVGAGLTSAASIVIPVAVYLAGLGMVLPIGIAGAMSPFPERAGAASSLLGFVQQTTAAVCGAGVGLLLGQTAWPLAGGIAAMGCATLLLWFLTRNVRREAHVRAAN